jgi:hypothetical protein
MGLRSSQARDPRVIQPRPKGCLARMAADDSGPRAVATRSP